MNTNEFLGDKMTQEFSAEVHLLASKSPLWWFTHLKVHALIGITRLTHNQVLHNQYKMGIHKPLAIH
jgi:hypothetical protein